ncbi:MAG: hypothetical protein ACLP1X_19140 [Polyangiaceae bacterium]|jgi:hypothetical protein
MSVRFGVGLLVVAAFGTHCASGASNELGAVGGGSSGSVGSSGSGTSNGASSSGSSGNGSGSGSYPSSGSTSSGGGGDDGGGSSSGMSSSGPGDEGGASSGSDSDGAAGSSSGGGSGGGSYNCFAAGSGTDFSTDGPLTPTSADNTTVACTIFQPTVLGSAGCLNPVIIWGNGTFNTPSNYTALFNHFASQGFIVAAADTSNSGSGTEMLACLTYIIGQNTTSGSPFEGHIDVNNIASSGYSQGGAGCLEAGIDPRFKVTAAVSPYIVIALGGYNTDSVMMQTHPMFLISGSADTVAVPSNNQEPIFMQAPVPIFWATHAGSTHFEVLNNGGAYEGPLTAWFRYKLMGDPAAEAWFEKPCDLCSASGWTVQTNSLWQ